MKRKQKKVYLKVGDRVWIKLPMNATIKKKTKYGFVITTDDGTDWSYFLSDEMSKVQ